MDKKVDKVISSKAILREDSFITVLVFYEVLHRDIIDKYTKLDGVSFKINKCILWTSYSIDSSQNLKGIIKIMTNCLRHTVSESTFN